MREDQDLFPTMTADATCSRLAPFGTSIFAEINELGSRYDVVDLGQGSPGFDAPDFIKEAAVAAIQDGHNQYAPTRGLPELRQLIAERFHRDTGVQPSWETEVTVTAGCTEAIATTCLGLLEPGDEVIVFEPFYDSYPPSVAMAGASIRAVTMHAPAFRIDRDALHAAVTQRTRAIFMNTPHNPTGRVLDREEMQIIADVAITHDLLVFSDEVYDRIVLDGSHVSIASLPGMWERTVTLNSLGKTYSATGWKTGWIVAPESLSAAAQTAHQYLIFSTVHPMQHAAVAAMKAPPEYEATLREGYRIRRDRLIDGLASVGLRGATPAAGYFILCDISDFGHEDDMAFVHHLITSVGVTAIPASPFYASSDEGRSLVRFAFCKPLEIIDAAIERLLATPLRV